MTAAFHGTPIVVAAVLGAVIVGVEGLLQLNQYQQNLSRIDPPANR